MDSAPTNPGQPYRQELSRHLGLGHLVVYGLIFIGPTAPMGVYGFVARKGFGMVPLVYLVGVVAMFFTALSYRQLSHEFPIAGSVYSYVQRALHPYAGFIAGWLILADYLLIPSLLYSFSAHWLAGLAPGVPAWIWIMMFLIPNTLTNILGIKLQAQVSFVLLMTQVVVLVVFMIMAIHYVFFVHAGAGGWSSAPFLNPRHMNFAFIATATSIAALSFLGFDGISTLAEEAHNPRRSIGTATVLTLLLLGAIFVVETYVAALAHPKYGNLSPTLGFFQIGREVGGKWLYVALILDSVIVADSANALAAQSAISRILFSMGRDRVLPGGQFLSRIHPHFKTPTNAIILVAVISFVIAEWVPITTILGLVNFGALSAFMLLNIATFTFFYIKRQNYRSVFQYVVFPLIGFLVLAFIWSGFRKFTLVFGCTWLAIGIVVGIMQRKKLTSIQVIS